MTPFDPDARERHARAEMAATRIPAPVAAGLVGIFLLGLAVGPLLELRALAAGRSKVWAPLPSADGALASARAAIDELEARYDERSELVRSARPVVQLLLSERLGYGNERAYLGRGGWLFFRPAFDHLALRPPPERVARATALAIRFRDALAERGIRLVVLPAPVKLAIEPGRFVASPPAPPVRPAAESEFLEILATAGVEILDPAARWREGERRHPLYLERDTHWRPEAVDEVAGELAIRLRDLGVLPVGDPDRWSEVPLEVAGEGDLSRLLGLPPAAGADAQRVTLRRVVDRAGALWAPERGAPVLLLGDSFAAVYSLPDLGWGSGAGLAERLALRLGLPVDRIVRNAGGASTTRAALAGELASDRSRLDGVRIVVWELATREITQGEWLDAPLPAPGPGTPGG
ncbi:MAG TPA: hypothetical protein VLA66_09265 [Thermoanaerobaculia bacterium]|nr:hypothetical protein [Thermoanaerobaculia bacterium]